MTLPTFLEEKEKVSFCGKSRAPEPREWQILLGVFSYTAIARRRMSEARSNLKSLK